jgi:VWFA-related protein
MHVTLVSLLMLTGALTWPYYSGQTQESTLPNNEPVPRIQTTTREVVLDVIVTKKDNHPVDGLARNDFVIEEDNIPQSIRSFERTSVDSTERSQKAPETILLIDQLNTRFSDFSYARSSLKKLFARNGGLLTQPTTLMLLTDTGVRVLAGPSQSRALLESALEQLPAMIVRQSEQNNSDSTTDRIKFSLEALSQIAAARAGSGTRKNIVWISSGFPALSSSQIDPGSADKIYDIIRSISDQLLKARIVVYTVDPRGVFGGDIFSDDKDFGKYEASLRGIREVGGFEDFALQALAVQTGGRIFFGRNDVDQEIADSIGAGDICYTLSYSPSNRHFDGRFRKIKVVLPGHPELRVRTRDGYYGLPDSFPANGKEADDQISEALHSRLFYNGVPFFNTIVTVVRDPPRARVSFAVDADAFTWIPASKGRMEAKMEVAAADFSGKDQLLHTVTRSYTAFLREDQLQSSDRKKITVHIETPVSLTAARLRLVVRDQATGHIGTANIAQLPPPQQRAPSDYLHRRDQ